MLASLRVWTHPQPRSLSDSQPRSSSFRKAENVWCASDRKAALTEAKSGKATVDRACKNPVADQFHAGEKLGMSGTPAILLDDGRLLPGYVPPEDLARLLNQPAD